VIVVERDAAAGGECVQRGTIPSKTLRESACHLLGLRARSEGVIDVAVPAHTKVATPHAPAEGRAREPRALPRPRSWSATRSSGCTGARASCRATGRGARAPDKSARRVRASSC
jgi:hypothetical protein